VHFRAAAPAVYRILGGRLERQYPYVPRHMDAGSYARMAVGAVVAVLAIGLVAPILRGVLPN
jgi:hypothetical protein